MLWMNAFPLDPVDPADPAQNFRRLDSMRLRGISAAFARNPGPISIQTEELLVRKPLEVSGGGLFEGAKPPQDSQGGFLGRSPPNMPELLGCPARTQGSCNRPSDNYLFNHISAGCPIIIDSDK